MCNGICRIPTGIFIYISVYSLIVFCRMVHCSLQAKKCGCGVFTIKKFPCVHALALLHRLGEKSGKKIGDLCDAYYLAETGNSFI